MIRARLAWLPAVLLLASCTEGSSPTPPAPVQPPETAFAVGTCRDLAPDILSLGRDLRLLGESESPPQEVRDRIKTAQDALREVEAAPEPGVDVPLQELVVTLGFLRLRSDSGTYTPDLAMMASDSYVELVEVCTSSSGTAPEPSSAAPAGPAPTDATAPEEPAPPG